MVAAKDVAADAGVANVGGDRIAYQKVIDAPAGVVLAGIKAIAPPAVDASTSGFAARQVSVKPALSSSVNLPRSSSEKLRCRGWTWGS